MLKRSARIGFVIRAQTAKTLRLIFRSPRGRTRQRIAWAGSFTSAIASSAQRSGVAGQHLISGMAIASLVKAFSLQRRSRSQSTVPGPVFCCCLWASFQGRGNLSGGPARAVTEPTACRSRRKYRSARRSSRTTPSGRYQGKILTAVSFDNNAIKDTNKSCAGQQAARRDGLEAAFIRYFEPVGRPRRLSVSRRRGYWILIRCLSRDSLHWPVNYRNLLAFR